MPRRCLSNQLHSLCHKEPAEGEGFCDECKVDKIYALPFNEIRRYVPLLSIASNKGVSTHEVIERETCKTRQELLPGPIIFRFKAAEEKLESLAERIELAASSLSSLGVLCVTWRGRGHWSSRDISGNHSSNRAVFEKLEQAKQQSLVSNVLVYVNAGLQIGDPLVSDLQVQIRLLLCPISDAMAKIAPTGNLGPQARLVLTLIKEKRFEQAKFWIDGALRQKRKREQLTGEQESAGDECPLPPLDFSEERTLFSKRG
mmetsp:Transcript_28692/g.62844  ORF Transcript_28692/g.62844 Transcript_28692/m.62844 type:complete len:258 (-) Transcript_28692:633-1406(-)